MDEETQKYIDNAVDAGERRAKNFALETAQKFDELRAEKGKWLRAWITANPLPAARVIGAVCSVVFLILGGVFGYLIAVFVK